MGWLGALPYRSSKIVTVKEKGGGTVWFLVYLRFDGVLTCEGLRFFFVFLRQFIFRHGEFCPF
uniref:Uncharacterized protein n=1 Tax=Arundo donax TaxID=35708 RepID=A0A0A9D853_ARUDO